jgi:arylsulfatase A-like enzyme
MSHLSVIQPIAILLLLACCSTLAKGAETPQSKASASAPNLVLILADDQGAGDYGFMGHPHIATPHLDKLAAQSVTFTRGFVPTSLCCPSLASIITGLYPHQHGITSNDPPAGPVLKGQGREMVKNLRGSSQEMVDRWNAALDAIPTLPRLLATRGYLSFQTGKWWHGDFSRGGFTHGMSKGTRHGDDGLTIGRESMQPIYDFIAESRKQEKPFFVWYAPLMPHSPHTPPERLLKKYAAKTTSPHIARYWAMCEWFDETCGALLGHLDQQGLGENTIVLYVTDNGWIQSPNKPAFAPKNKTTPFDAGHRTPIMIRWPGKAAPQRSDALASSIDLLPTVLAALDMPKPDGAQGINLLDPAALKSRQHVFGECFTIRSQSLDDPTASVLWRWVTDGRWRLILPRTAASGTVLPNLPRDKYLTPDLLETLTAAKPMLFDLNSDPAEENDLAAEQPEMVNTLTAHLNALWSPKLR